ncbi:MAG: apolipoprotein N-acyltransferase [Deltaproteobacteria bacterium]|nr:MAG: apolipoprotein N-acyltransferase [Deltaproteobacteria bacterium]
MNGINLKDAGLAGLSGLILTASFSPIGLDWIAWISLIPLLVSIKDKSSIVALRLGLLAGLCHYLTLIYWIVVVLSNYGNISLILSLGVLTLLSLYLALYIAFFALIVIGFKKYGLSPFWGASVWVALEYARTHIMTGFPWCLLGYSQYSRLPLIQISEISGVYGISFIIVLVNIVLYKIFFTYNPTERKLMAIEITLTFFLVGFILIYGYVNLREKADTNLEGKGLRAVIIQGNIDQSLKWNPDFQERTLAIYNKLSGKSVDFRPQIIIWPETAVPFFFQDRSYLSKEVFKAAKITNSNILFGSPAYVKDKDDIFYYNRAYILSENRVFDHYDKVHLVPFGEYVPLKKYIPFVHRLVPAAGDFSSGKEVKPINTPDLRIGVLICFEAIFPDISRKFAIQGAELIVNITNDAWFGHTSAPYQHLSMAVFRCIENGLPMARAANTGISAFILANGKIVDKSGLFVRDVLKKEIKLRQNKTFYSQSGDIFAILILIITIIRSLWILTTTRRR